MAEAPTKKKLASGRHTSAIKRFRQSEKRNVRNRHQLSTIKTAVKKLHAAVADKKKKEIESNLKAAMSLVSKAGSKGIIHKSKASRMISQLMKAAKT